ncbi:M1 family metallopeptidase [Nocardioides aquiterrae]|uniref:Aminopeptidase N n=1 Tax=Nocardioides aquiterrae TaxID=203799 RepID=A0ABP4EWD9_9ACTN
MTTRARVRRTALAVGAALLLPLGVAQAAPAGDTQGARGIGDPYYPDYGNGGYDVDHYGIHISYRPSSDRVAGRTRITAHATQDLSRFNLDFVLPVSSVQVNGRRASYDQGRHELVVTPRRPLATGEPMTVVVRYAGVPSTITSDGAKPWIRTADGAAAVGEPEIAAWWYPANDHPRDKATYDVSVTVAKDLEVLGNGRLVSRDVRHGKRTWHWRETRPMAPYLAFFVAGQFDITRSRADGLPVITAVASHGGPEGRYAAADLKRTPQVIRFESRLWGPYPFDAMGGVAPAADFGFALENQTRPVYTRGFWSKGPNIYVVVHELAHQWYGDSVSVHNWRDIWLNEGFATFTAWLWSEKHHEGSAKQLFHQSWRTFPSDDPFWKVKVGNPGAHNEFNGAVYVRGAMALQALRTRIGNAAFMTVMRTWAAEHQYGNGTVRQYIALAESVSGADLTSFFDAWLYTGRRPAPTEANGFPPDFQARSSAARVAVPASWAKIRHTQALLARAEAR